MQIRPNRTAIVSIDQAISSLVTLLLSAVVAKVSTPAQFGQFAIVYLIAWLALGACRALLGESALLLTAGKKMSVGGRLIACALAIGIALAAILVVVAETGLWPYNIGLLIGASVAIPGILVQDACRYAAFIAQKPTTALVSDAAELIALAAGSSYVLLTHASASTEVAIWGLSALIASVFVVVPGLVPRPEAPKLWDWAKHTNYLPSKVLSDFAVSSGVGQAANLLVPLVASITAAGYLRSGAVALGPLNVAISATMVILVPTLRRYALAGKFKNVLSTAYIVSLGSVGIGVTAALVLRELPFTIGHAVLGASWSTGRDVAPILAIQLAMQMVAQAAATCLRVIDRVGRAVVIRVISSFLAAFGLLLGAALDGAVGGAVGSAAAAAVAAVGWLAYARYSIRLSAAASSPVNLPVAIQRADFLVDQTPSSGDALRRPKHAVRSEPVQRRPTSIRTGGGRRSTRLVNDSATNYAFGRTGLPIFAFVYLFYFVFGSINFVDIRGRVGFRVDKLAVLGLAFFALGILFAAVVSQRKPQLKRFSSAGRSAQPSDDAEHAQKPSDYPRRSLMQPCGYARLAKICGVIGALAFLGVLIQFRGLPLFAGEARLLVSGYLALLIYGLVLALIVVGAKLTHDRASWRKFVVVGIGPVLLLVIGFRTITLVAAGTIVVQSWLSRRWNIRIRAVLFAALVLYVFSLIAVYRFGAGASAYLNEFDRLGVPRGFAPFLPIWATPREGTSVFNLLTQAVPAFGPYQHGRVIAAAFTSVLPGKQTGPRLIVAQYVNGRPGVTITPSILGEPYLDFGVAGIAGLMFFLGFVMWVLYKWQRSAVTWAPQLLYSFALVTLILDIHAGLLDLSIFASFAVLFLFAVVAESSAKRSRVESFEVKPVTGFRAKQTITMRR